MMWLYRRDTYEIDELRARIEPLYDNTGCDIGSVPFRHNRCTNCRFCYDEKFVRETNDFGLMEVTNCMYWSFVSMVA